MLTYEQIQATRARCAELGTDKEFQEFVRVRASCVSGLGRGSCVYAHVRRAALGGMGMKTEFSGVPLTDEEHKLQHQKGEAAVLFARFGFLVTAAQAKEWFDKEAQYLRLEFIKMKERKNDGQERG